MANFITSILFFLFTFLSSSHAIYNVVSLGAKSDGTTDSTKSLLKAWALACSSAKPETIYVPTGRYLLKPVQFRGPCKNRIVVRIDGTLVAPSDYRVLGNSNSWLLFIKVTGLSVIGGNLDARGATYWACKTSGRNCPAGARSITFNYANDVVISGLTSINSQITHVVVNGCSNVMVRGVKIVAPDLSPNTDGIHVQFSSGVTITRSSIKTGDDCVSIGSGTKNLWIDRVSCGPGHGISIGSLAKDKNEQGVQNVTVKDSTLTGTDNGLRIKSWARPSNGFVRGVLYQNIIMNNVKNPILIDQKYCPNNRCPKQSSGVKISQVTYRNIKGTSATQVAVKFDCSSSNPCRGIRLEDVKLTYQKGAVQSSCVNAGGTAGGLVMPADYFFHLVYERNS
ncbi:PREDICTED: polygalacturonase-like [Nelumbo nucifera]|uniref:Polygalacturonase-like n=1 Tax=Nelumbo nucifera TaxID=4432 RepID=A0A1U8B9D9_NELNU|nr:PREDICTED: polygalacturonase-like [Nelumbo nucifera]